MVLIVSVIFKDSLVLINNRIFFVITLISINLTYRQLYHDMKGNRQITNDRWQQRLTEKKKTSDVTYCTPSNLTPRLLKE